MFSSERKLIVFLTVFCLLLALLGYAWKQRTSVPFVSATIENIMAPMAYGAARTLKDVHTGITVIDEAIVRTTRLSELENEKAELLQKQVNYDEVVAENMRLRRLLDYERSYGQFDVTLANVVTRDRGNWTNTFTIDRGSAEGIEKNMPIVVPSGVVGFVSDVYLHSARVQTVLDPRTAIGVIVQRPESRVASVIRGNGNSTVPRMVNIAKEGDVLAGDTLITSGYGGVYPKGLLVGYAVNIEQDPEGFVKHANVQLAADVNNVEEVFVIRYSREGAPDSSNLSPRLIPYTQRDQVQGVKGANKQ